jgi:hypothetical protein
MNFKSVLRLFNTVRHLKLKQIRFQLYYRIKALYYKQPVVVDLELERITHWKPIIYNAGSHEDKKFTFLNISHKFDESIDWNYAAYGKLWTYNLNYFEFLNSKECDRNTGYEFIKDYCDQHINLKDGLEPYPTSLRIMNWIKFLSFHRVNDPQVNGVLFHDLQILIDHLEYHILANHFLENIFAIYMASIFFNDLELNSKFNKLLKEQLEEQILVDGGHFEQSPMYHQIILYRLLDVVHYHKLNAIETDGFIMEKVKQMLSWIENITFSNGDIPYINDAAPNIAPSTLELINYGEEVGIIYSRLPLSDSGYRKFVKANYEVLVDVANIESNYQPGHLHADALQFILYEDGTPLFVDTGVSTYEKNSTRNKERSTCSHNTVVVDDKNQYEVWGGFRVGRRSEIEVIQDTDDCIEACIRLYYGGVHHRDYNFSDHQITITDIVNTTSKKFNKAHFHLDKSRVIEASAHKNKWIIDKHIHLNFENTVAVEVQKYDQAIAFNKIETASKIVVTFTNQLKTTIEL